MIARLRAAKSAAFDLHRNSTARRTVSVDFWGDRRNVYANANFSIYSRQHCNAACTFCVEELRPASRGGALEQQRTIERDDRRYLAALDRCLVAVAPLNPTVSVTGGEPSQDPRLVDILKLLARHRVRKQTVTTNGSGLLDLRQGRPLVEWIAQLGTRHLNVSRAHTCDRLNAKLMRFDQAPNGEQLQHINAVARRHGTRLRLSCVLIDGAVDDLDAIVKYIDFARSIGIDNVIFRQLMKSDPRTVVENYVVKYSQRRRVALEPILEQISRSSEFAFIRQIVGYYYYVEVWRYRGVDVVFEEADLAHLEDAKLCESPERRLQTIHELVFHPNGRLASTWQPWDGVLGPRDFALDKKKPGRARSTF